MVSTGAVVGMTIVLCFVLAMLCMFMKRSGTTRGSSAVQGRQGGHEEEGGAYAEEAADMEASSAVSRRGLNEALVQSLPLYQLPSTLLNSAEPCPICLSSFLAGQFVRVLPACYHTFHLPCIDQWFSSHSNCPLCRSHITPVLTH